MSRKNLVVLIGAALAFAGSNAAMACSTAAWTATGPNGGVQGSPIAAEGDDAIATRAARYSGRCGLRANAPANFVRDDSPNAEPNYRARFYLLAPVTGGEATVFRVNGGTVAAPVERFNVRVAPNAIIIGGTSVPATAGRWYSVEVAYGPQSGPGGNSAGISYVVNGNSTSVGITPPPQTGTVAVAAGAVDFVELGWIAGGTVGAGASINVDAFESRRSTAIGRLLRGDAGGQGSSAPDGDCNASDVTATQRDITAVLTSGGLGVLSSGQSDCTEDGQVNSSDVTCIARVIQQDLFSAGTRNCGAPISP